MKFLALSAFVFLLTGITFSQGRSVNTWNSITPLITKMSEVENLLGKPFSGGTSVVRIYDTENERVTVWYNGAKPSEDSVCKWNASDDTVAQFIVASKKPLFISDLKFDLGLFKREASIELEHEILYVNKRDGIRISAHKFTDEDRIEKEGVIFIQYSPNERDKKEKCLPIKPERN